MSSFNDKFQDLRDSIESRITKARDGIRIQNLRRIIRKKIQNFNRPVRRITDSFRPPSHSNAETNTENIPYNLADKAIDSKNLNTVTEIYPALPRNV